MAKKGKGKDGTGARGRKPIRSRQEGRPGRERAW